MKKILLISALLAFALAVQSANALTVQNISVTETGGIIVSGEASASGSSDASAEVWSIIESQGSDTRVRVDIKTAADGEEHATSVERTIQSRDRLDVSARTSSGDAEAAEAEGEVSVESAEPVMPSLLLFDRLSSFLEKLFNFVFFFW